jgi:hypothetical protein
MIRFAAIALILSSCTPAYIAGVRNVPIFKEKGEVQLSTYAGLTNGPNDLDGNFQVAWAPIKYVAVTGSLLYINHAEEEYSRYHKSTDMAIGFYKPGSTYLDCFVGYGKGRAYNYLGSFFGEDIFASGQYQRFTLQPTVALERKNFSFAYTARFSWVDFDKYESDRYQAQPLDGKLIMEPCVTTRILLFKSIYPTLQMGFNFHLNDAPFFEYQLMHIAVGVQWKPSDLWKKSF